VTIKRTLTALTALLLLTAVAVLPASPSGAVVGGLIQPSSSWTLGGVACDLIAVPAATPVGVGTCPGVRPGAVVQSDVGSCTFNFLFNGSDGRRYMGTAGHCILEAPAVGGQAPETTWPMGGGPVARDGAGNRIGEFAYAILEDPKDFALVRLDAGVVANPQMCHFGGPTGINNDLASGPVTLEHFGNGIGIGTVLPARSAVALGMPDPDHVYALGAVVPGDSGSGIISADGRAVGVIVTTGLHLGSIGFPDSDAGAMGITRISPQVQRASQVLEMGLTLQTAPKL